MFKFDMEISEVKEKLKNCIEDSPPFCTEACPFHLDTKDLITKIERGRILSAYNIFRNAVGFPAVVSNVCTKQCESVCPRKENGGSINLNSLEKTLVDLSKSPAPVSYNLPQKKESIAIIGAGPCGLACGMRLSAKKYNVTVFEKSSKIGGHLWDVLSSEIFIEEIHRETQHLDWKIKLNHPVDDVSKLKAEGFDAIFVATGSQSSENNTVYYNDVDESEWPDGVFVGGSKLGLDTVKSIASGLDNAQLIERYLMTGRMIRQKEVIKSQLRLSDFTGREYEEVIMPDTNEIYSKDTAKKEASRCFKCTCDACYRNCSLMQYYKKFPRKIAEDVRGTTEVKGVQQDITIATKMIASCSQCGLCKEVCPQGIDMQSLFLKSRQVLQNKDKMPWAFHEFFLRDMEFANGPAKFFSSNSQTVDYIFFPGCQMTAASPQNVIHVYEMLKQWNKNLGVLAQCCGAPAVWAGKSELQESIFLDIEKVWTENNRPILILGCMTCKKMIETYLPKIKTQSLYELIGKFPENFSVYPKTTSTKYSVFHPCSARDDYETKNSIEKMLLALNIDFDVMSSGDSCCGYGGLTQIVNSDYTTGLTCKLVENNNNRILTYCTNCNDKFHGEGLMSTHILDLFWGSVKNESPPPTLSQRWKNRLNVKKILTDRTNHTDKLNRETNNINNGGNTYEILIGKNSFPLIIDAETLKTVNNNLIMEDDIISVIEYCEKNSEKIVNEDGSFTGHLLIGRVTYWVTYIFKNNNFILINAYSHRVRIQQK